MSDLPDVAATVLNCFDALGEATTYDVFKRCRDLEQHLTIVGAYRTTGWLEKECLIEVAGGADGHTTYRVTDAGKASLESPTT